MFYLEAANSQSEFTKECKQPHQETQQKTVQTGGVLEGKRKFSLLSLPPFPLLNRNKVKDHSCTFHSFKLRWKDHTGRNTHTSQHILDNRDIGRIVLKLQQSKKAFKKGTFTASKL